jgi:hypothetical protein
MKTVQIYDPPMCCSTGLCSNEIDPSLVSFAAMLTRLGENGVAVERYNLAQQPGAFVRNPDVKALLDKEGLSALPLIFVDGELHSKGHYWTETERAALLRLADGRNDEVAS